MIQNGAATMEKFDYYTKARNYLFDKVVPEITRLCKQGKTAALILFTIERKAAGFHKDQAAVSIADMESFINASRSDIKRARSWLIGEGFVEVLGGGSGLETSELRVVLDPEERAEVKARQEDQNIGSPITRQKETEENNPMADNAKDKQAVRYNSKGKKISRASESTSQTPSIGHLNALHTRPQSAGTMPQNAKKSPHGEEVLQTPDSEPVEPHHQTPDPEPETSSRNFQYESALKASEIKGVLTDPSSRASSDLVSDPGLKKETNKEYVYNQAITKEKVDTFYTVCSFVQSQNAKMEDRDYAFIKWTMDAYGPEYAREKMQIAKFQMNRGIKFANPLAWYRNALTLDYKQSKFDKDVLKARERSRRQTERAAVENAESEAERRKWESYREQNPDAAKNALASFLGGLGK